MVVVSITEGTSAAQRAGQGEASRTCLPLPMSHLVSTSLGCHSERLRRVGSYTDCHNRFACEHYGRQSCHWPWWGNMHLHTALRLLINLLILCWKITNILWSCIRFFCNSWFDRLSTIYLLENWSRFCINICLFYQLYFYLPILIGDVCFLQPTYSVQKYIVRKSSTRLPFWRWINFLNRTWTWTWNAMFFFGVRSNL